MIFSDNLTSALDFSVLSAVSIKIDRELKSDFAVKKNLKYFKKFKTMVKFIKLDPATEAKNLGVSLEAYLKVK